MAVKAADLGTGRTGGREATTGVIPGRVALSVGCPDIEPPNGWKWTSLSSVAQLESGHTPSRNHPEYWDDGIPWIGIKDATENHGRTLSDTYQHVSALGLENSSARLLPVDTVCLSRTASVGFVVVMGRPMATSQDFVNWVCGPNIEPHYLKYVLLAENEALWRFASGTTHQTIYYPEAKAFHVCLPSITEQKAIAAVLGALDDKIELNRRMNATLEAMARALFQSWFVDFDPVRAKLDGRKPIGLDEATVALFPEHLMTRRLDIFPRDGRWEDLLTSAQTQGAVSSPATSRQTRPTSPWNTCRVAALRLANGTTPPMLRAASPLSRKAKSSSASCGLTSTRLASPRSMASALPTSSFSLRKALSGSASCSGTLAVTH